MLRLDYLKQNLLRNPIRTGLTAFAVSMPIVVYILSMAIVRNLESFLDQSVQQMRLVVVQKSSLINPLPAGYRRKIEALDPTGTRIVSVCRMRWFGGRVPGSQTQNYFMAVDVDTFAKTYPEFTLSAEERQRWNTERRAAIVGRAPAGDYGWKVGDVITLEATVPPYQPLEMVIVAIPQDTLDAETSFLRYDYLNDDLKAPNALAADLADKASFFFVKCASRDDLAYFREKIDETFARDTDQTKTQDEKSFMEAFITAQFDLPNRLRLLSYVVVAVAVMAAANTMMMSFRDRSGEFAILKTLGFRPLSVAALLFAESMTIAIAGGIVGAGVPYVAFNYTPLAEMRVPMIGLLQVRAEIVFEALAIAAAVGALAALVPAVRVTRLGLIDALRRVG